jgi:hypothetical protein
MIISLVILFGLETAMLFATLDRINKDENLFEDIMTFVLIGVYALAIVIYVPLFITVMRRLKLAYPEVHA